MAATVTDPLLGTVVDGRYEVLSRIARGGMATVYLAQDRRLDRRVALKVMHPHLADGSDVVARFRREARAAARLSHPGVVGVYDQGMEGEASYLTMEFVDGATLRRRLQQQGSLTLGESLDVLDAVLDALGAAHRAGLVHRDVKPENVLIARDGTVKVADFGLARAVTEATMSTTGALLGTVAYLSPEIVTQGEADARADVYAAGVMLYEMLTGEQPYRGETPIQVAWQHVNERVPSLSDSFAWLPLEIDDLVAALTARDPADRPRNADAALAQLRRLRGGLDDRTLAMRAQVDPGPDDDGDLTADVETTSAGTGDLSTARVGATVALPIGAVGARGGGATTAAATTGPDPDPDDARRRRRRSRRIKALVTVLLVLAALGGGVAWYLVVGPGAYTTTPDVVGRAETSALAALEDAGLRPTTTTASSDTVPPGHVVSTDPAPGDRIEREGDVAVVVSSGVLRVTVPDVAGRSEAAALAELADAGLDGDLLVEEVYDQEIPAGQVVSTAPTSGSVVDHDAEVTVNVSAGREPIKVPDVTGSPSDEAVAAVEEAGATPQLGDEAYSDTVPEGSVVSQDVTGDAFRGDLVNLVVSLGPELFEVPGVVGQQYDDAEAELEALGFVVEREDALGGFFGTVRSQSVEAGAMVAAGTVIVLTVV